MIRMVRLAWLLRWVLAAATIALVLRDQRGRVAHLRGAERRQLLGRQL